MGQNYQRYITEYVKKMAKLAINLKKFNRDIKGNNGIHPLTQELRELYSWE